MAETAKPSMTQEQIAQAAVEAIMRVCGETTQGRYPSAVRVLRIIQSALADAVAAKEAEHDRDIVELVRQVQAERKRAETAEAQLTDARRAVWEEAAKLVAGTVCLSPCGHDKCEARRKDAAALRARAQELK